MNPPMTHETQNLEWKESWHDDYLRWICGFANAQGGKCRAWGRGFEKMRDACLAVADGRC